MIIVILNISFYGCLTKYFPQLAQLWLEAARWGSDLIPSIGDPQTMISNDNVNLLFLKIFR